MKVTIEEASVILGVSSDCKDEDVIKVAYRKVRQPEILLSKMV